MQLITKNIKILLKFTNITCFLPHYDEKSDAFKIQPFYHSTVCTIYLLAYIYMFYVKITLEGELFPERGKLFVITSAALAFVGAYWLITIATKKGVANLQRYFDYFEEIDRSLSAIFKVKIKPVNIYTSIILVGYLMCITISYHLWSRDVDSLHYELHFTSDILMIMGNLAIVLVTVYTLECMKRRYDVLADIVGRLSLDEENVAVISYRIDNVSRLHNVMSDSVLLFNEIFSWRMLGFILYTLIVDLLSLGYFATGFYDEDIRIYISTSGWTFVVTLQVVVIAAMCEKVVGAAKRSTLVTYKTTSRLSGSLLLRSKMVILSSQMEARCPKFTAAGFFEVDHAMIFTFANLMVTYLIVIIQFVNNS